MADTMAYYILFKAGYLTWNPFETFKDYVDHIGTIYAPLEIYRDMDPKNSKLLQDKYNFISMNILK